MIRHRPFLIAGAIVALGLTLDAGVPLGLNRPRKPSRSSARADVLKRPGTLAPRGGTGVPFDIDKLKAEQAEEGGRQLPADPDLEPGVLPLLDLPAVQLAETSDIPPPVPLAAGTFTVGRTSMLAPPFSSSVSEPSVGGQGDGIFVTNNWGASKSANNGSTWTTIDPFSTFPNSPAAFSAGVCCDQRVIQDPSRDLIIWFLQYSLTAATAAGTNGLRIAVANGQAGLAANTWTYHDITPADFGLTSKWLDFPTMQISSNYLYITSNFFDTVTNAFGGAAIARIPLANLANNTAYTMNTFTTASYGSITGVNGASSTMYFGARFGTTSIKVLTWPEANSSPTESTVSGLSTISFTAFTCTTPDGLNPCGRADTRMQTGWVTPTELGFMWSSSQDGTHPYPWTKVAILNPATLAVISQPDIFSADSAWLYPAVAVNARGHIAGVIDKLGGSGVLPQVRAIIRDDFSPDVTVSGWETYTLSTSTHGTASRWGDYNGATAHEKYPNTWLGVGHIQQGGNGDTNSGQPHAKVMNYAFYRERDDPTLPSLSINDVTVTEGNAGPVSATFTVSLSAASGSTVTVSAATANNTAVAPGDYTAVGATTLTFNPGVTTQTFTVSVQGDLLDEPNETFFVNLSAPANATILDGQGLGTITDDDNPPTISINDVTVTEGNVGPVSATFTVSLSAASGQTVTVSAATANNTAVSPGDYTAVGATTLTFAAGATTQNFTVSVQGDTLDEINETFFVNLSAPANATILDGQGLGTITDDDNPPTISINDVTVTEGNAGPVSATFSVSLSAASGQAVTVSAATADNNAVAPGDYTAVGATTLTFNAGVTTQTFTVSVQGDTLDELNETYFVNLSAPVNASILDSQGIGTITDDDATPSLSINDATVTEGNVGPVSATFTVSLSAASGQTVTVSAATANNTAVAPGDYTAAGPTTLTFNPGATAQTFTVSVQGDTLDETNETYFVNLSAPVNATILDGQGLGTITDDDSPPTISINDVTVTEGNAGPVSATFTVSLSAASGQTVTVSAATANGTAVAPADYTAAGATTLTFAAGATTQSFTVLVQGDLLDEANETFFVNLSAPTNASILDGQGLGTITDDDNAPTISINDVTVTEGNAGPVSATFSVSLSAASGQAVTVSAATADNNAVAPGDYTAVGATTLTFNAGVTTQNFTVSVQGDTLDETNETFFVNLSAPTNASILDGQGVGTITDDDNPPGISINDVTVMEGNAGFTNAVFTVSLSAASSFTVGVSAQTAPNTATSPADFTATGPTALTFNPGATTQTFSVPVAGDVLAEGNETFFVNLSGASNGVIADGQGVGTIADDELPMLSIGDVSVSEGNAGSTNLVFAVTLSAPGASTITVSAQAVGGSATAGSDFTAAGPLTLTFAPGVTSQSFSVPIFGDTLSESDETVVATLSAPVNALIADGTAIGTILNDDAAPPARVFVASTGSDLNECSVQTTPCRNLAEAISRVAIDGEVIVLEPGEYESSPLVIAKGMKITAPSGTVAFVRQPITIDAPGGRVVLRGLTIKGDGAGAGIALAAADMLSIEECAIDRWSTGLNLAPASGSFVSVANSVFVANTSGVSSAAGGTNRISMEGVRFEGNGTGLVLHSGVSFVRESAFTGHSAAGITIDGGSVDIQRSEFALNFAGVNALTGGTVRISRSRVFGNVTGLSAGAGSTFQSGGTNVIRGNGTNTTGTITAIPEQ